MPLSNPNEFPPPIPALRSLCIAHLKHEASILAAAVSLLGNLEAAFRQPSSDAITHTLQRHADVATLIENLNRQRASFRAAAARILRIAPEAITVPAVVARLPQTDRAALTAEVTRVRGLAEELTALNRRVSVFVRVHLDAYQRILHDLTNSRRGSGRYGPTGSAESHEYRSLIQVHG